MVLHHGIRKPQQIPYMLHISPAFSTMALFERWSSWCNWIQLSGNFHQGFSDRWWSQWFILRLACRRTWDNGEASGGWGLQVSFDRVVFQVETLSFCEIDLKNVFLLYNGQFLGRLMVGMFVNICTYKDVYSIQMKIMQLRGTPKSMIIFLLIYLFKTVLEVQVDCKSKSSTSAGPLTNLNSKVVNVSRTEGFRWKGIALTTLLPQSIQQLYSY